MKDYNKFYKEGEPVSEAEPMIPQAKKDEIVKQEPNQKEIKPQSQSKQKKQPIFVEVADCTKVNIRQSPAITSKSIVQVNCGTVYKTTLSAVELAKLKENDFVPVEDLDGVATISTPGGGFIMRKFIKPKSQEA